MYDLEVNGHKLKDLASRAITLIECQYGIKLNETQKYFLGKEIQRKSGKYISLKVSETSKYVEMASKLNED